MNHLQVFLRIIAEVKRLLHGTAVFFRELIFFREKTEKVPYRILVPYARYLRPVWPLVALGLISGLASAGLTTLIPLISKIFIDNIVLKNSPAGQANVIENSPLGLVYPVLNPFFQTLQGLVLFLVGIGILLIIFSLLSNYAQTRFGEEYTFHLQGDLYKYVLAFPLSYFKDQWTGYLVNRMNSDITNMQYIYSRFFIQLATQIFSLAIVISILISLNVRLVLVMLLFVPAFMLVNYFFIRRIRFLIREGRERDAYVYRDLQEILAGIEVVKAHSAEEREYQRLVRTVRDAIGNRVRNSLYGSVSGQLMYGIQGLALLTVFWIGGQDVLAGTMTLGGFVAFSAYITLFNGTISGLISSPMQLQPALVSASRLNEIFALSPEWARDSDTGTTEKRGPLRGQISLRDVWFSYREGNPVLKGVTLDMAPDTITVLVGKTGSGKTTLANLILRFLIPQKGQIAFDGNDSRDLDPRWLRDQIAIVSQDMFLFHATLEQNIRYSRPQATLDEIIDASGKAEIHEDITKMPEGYQTVVGERGAKLSSGQRQRVAIARAFLKNAPIVILDEPTSHLDRETEKQIERTLHTLARGRTTLLITHRDALLSLGDAVYELRDGSLKKLNPGFP
jgi:ABC-type multidrug transport system fused ATPase/permease subunit